MKILAFDCAGSSISCAITEDYNLIGETILHSEKKHSETLLTAIYSLMNNCNVVIDDIALFGITVGPGSFTGVRIGVSLLKGLDFGKNIPCVAVSTLEALAYNLNDFDGLVCPVMDARREQFYNALFKNGKRLCNDRLISSEELLKEIEHYNEMTYFVGDGAYIAKKTIPYKNAAFPLQRLSITSGYSVAVIALNNYLDHKNVFSDIEISPLYLRLSQAERERAQNI